MKARTACTQFTLTILLLALLVSLSAAVLAQTATFTNPIVRSRTAPDPWMVYKDGFYYFTFTAGNRIEIWKSATITDIDRGTKVTVWRAPASGPQCCNIWAPELHFINGRWYIYYAADNGNDINHRMYVLESTGTDAQGTYLDKGKIYAPSDRWAIDGSVLQQPDSSLFFIWSGWAGARQGPQNIYIALMSNPWTISGERTLISAPVNYWETVGWAVNEGPTALQKDGKVFIVYSASGVSTADYCLGTLTNTGGNVLDPSSWVKSPGCVFAKADSVFGPGHSSFVKSPDQTEDWMFYHARDTAFRSWEGRTARAQKFTWNADGTPDFGRPVSISVAWPVPSGESTAVPPPPPTPTPTPTPGPTPIPTPELLTEANTERAIALDSVTWVRDPFPLIPAHNFSPDQRTRVMFFALHLDLQPGEDTSSVTAQAEDSQHSIYPLAVEYVGKVPGFDWLTQIIVRLPKETENVGDVRVSINALGMTSNRAVIAIRPLVNIPP